MIIIWKNLNTCFEINNYAKKKNIYILRLLKPSKFI